MTSAGIRTHPFRSASFWRKPLGVTGKHVLSDAYVASLVRQLPKYYGAAAINTGDYSVSTYTASPKTPLVQVKYSNCQHKSGAPDTGFLEQIAAVPIPADAVPPRGTDGAMVIWQPSTKTVWELWQAGKRPDGWYACWGGRIQNADKSDGVFPWPYGVSASGLSLLAGLIRVNELQSSVIKHAIALSLPEIRKGVFVPPANRTDGAGNIDDPMAIPEGTRFRLDPTLDVAGLKLSPVARMIAKAAQTYGIVVTDFAGVVAFQGENERIFKTNLYPALFGGKPNYRVLDGFPWERLVALPV